MIADAPAWRKQSDQAQECGACAGRMMQHTDAVNEIEAGVLKRQLENISLIHVDVGSIASNRAGLVRDLTTDQLAPPSTLLCRPAPIAMYKREGELESMTSPATEKNRR